MTDIRFTTCSSCGAQIVFLKTAAGKQMPVDADMIEMGDEEWERERHGSHWATCPSAQQHKEATG